MRSKFHPMDRLLLALGLAAVGCTASSEEVRPPAEGLFFPTGAAVSPDDSHLFVTNANSELRYDSGTVSVLAIDAIDAVANDWVTSQVVPPDCRQDGEFTETLVCEAGVLLGSTSTIGVRIGNFASDLAIQDISAGSGTGALRLFVPTRGDPSIAWIDWDGSRLSCTTGTEGYSLCDEDHRLSFVNNDADSFGIPEEPFGVFADTGGQFAMVTHLTTGAVTLIDSPVDGPAVITDIDRGVFQPDPSTGLRGATGIVGRTPDQANDIIYVGSRSEDRVQTFTVGRPANGANPFLVQGGWFFLDAVGSNNGMSKDTRGMAFSGDGSRLYLVNRRPPSLQIYDTSMGPTGTPRNEPIGATDLCRQASTVTVVPDIGDGERVYVTCFQDGQVYIIDPRGEGHIEDIVTVGRGPYSVVAAPTSRKVFVTNFLEDTVAVIDIAPGSPRRNRVVLRIGEPRPL
jgi:YVTN family beta-propeller protein